MTEVPGSISPRRRKDIIDALRRGTVPQQGLDVLAVGLAPFEDAVDEELQTVSGGGAVFKAVRGEYGSGKTFFSRWLTERAKRAGFATTEVQISETETPLHKLETVYRRITENLSTSTTQSGALRDVIDGWFYILEHDAKDGAAQSAGSGRNARPPPTSTVGCLEGGAGLRRCAAAVPAGADGG